jgi:hypothetical protein
MAKVFKKVTTRAAIIINLHVVTILLLKYFAK